MGMIRNDIMREGVAQSAKELNNRISTKRAELESEGMAEEAIERLMGSAQRELDRLNQDLRMYDTLCDGDMSLFTSRDLSLEDLGDLLIAGRIAQGLTLEDLAEQTGLTVEDLAVYERHGYGGAVLTLLLQILMTFDLEVTIKLK